MTIGTLTQVFVGNVANDGTGDTLRQAFIITNDNMANLYGSLGNPIGSAIISNSSGISFDIGDTILDTFDPTVYRTVRYIVSVSNDTPAYQASEFLVIQDGINANLQVNGESVVPPGSPFVTFSSNIVSGNVLLWASTLSANNVVKFQTVYITV